MRDAFGGTFMIKLFLVFIVFYVTFMTIAVNYAKVFRVKNNVINILEQSQFNYDNESDWNDIVTDRIDSYLSGAAYNYGSNVSVKNNCISQGGRLSNNGVCITKLSDSYYRATVYLVVSFPLFNLSFAIPISSETEVY